MPSMCGKRCEQVLCTASSIEYEVEFCFINYHKYGNSQTYNQIMYELYLTPRDDKILENHLKPYIVPFKIIGYVILILVVMLFDIVVLSLDDELFVLRTYGRHLCRMFIILLDIICVGYNTYYYFICT